MPYITRPKDGFFRVSMTLQEYKQSGVEFVEAVKEYLAPDKRDYCDKDQQWTFGSEHYQPVRTLLRQFFVEGVHED